MSKKLSQITPGDALLEEFLKPVGITQNHLARDINVQVNRVSQIIHGKRKPQRLQRCGSASISGLNPGSGLISGAVQYEN